MPSFCAVLDCVDKYGHGSNISFHKFPFKNKELLDKWVAFTLRQIDWRPTQWNAICSRHFKPEDYKGLGKMRKILKKTAIPSIRNEGQQQPTAIEAVNATKATALNSRTYETPVGGKQKAGIRIMRGKRVYEDLLRDECENQDNSGDESSSVESESIENTTPSPMVTETKSTFIQRTSPEASKFHCRLCGAFTTAVVTFSSNFEIYGMVQKCFPTLNIRSEDNLPKEICRVCLKRVKSFASFIDNVLETQSKFQNKLLVEKPSNKSNARQLKFKQEPTAVRVKTEINDNGYGDQDEDIEANAEEPPLLETPSKFAQSLTPEQQQIDRKLQFCDFPMLNAQDIINNCDIMEIINLDDPFIDIPDDDCQNERLSRNDNELHEAAGGGVEIERKFVRNINDGNCFNSSLPDELLASYMLIEEHSYATNDLKEESYMRKFYKKEKPDADVSTGNEQEALSALIKDIHRELSEGDGKGDCIPDYIHEELVVATSSTPVNETMPQEGDWQREQRLDRPVVTSIDKIGDQSTGTCFPRVKPNIVVLNESIVKSSPAFQLQECPDCHLKFFSNDTMRQHQMVVHGMISSFEKPPSQPHSHTDTMGTEFGPMVSVPSKNLNSFSNNLHAHDQANFQTPPVSSHDGGASSAFTSSAYHHEPGFPTAVPFHMPIREDVFLAANSSAESSFMNKSDGECKKVKSKNKVKILDMQQTFQAPYQGLLPSSSFEPQGQATTVLLPPPKTEHIPNHIPPEDQTINSTELENKNSQNNLQVPSVENFINQTTPTMQSHYAEQMQQHSTYLNILPTIPPYQEHHNTNPQQYSTMSFGTTATQQHESAEDHKLLTLPQNSAAHLPPDMVGASVMSQGTSCSSQLYDGFSRNQSLTYAYCQMTGNAIANHSSAMEPQAQAPLLQTYVPHNAFSQHQHQSQHEPQETQNLYNAGNFFSEPANSSDDFKSHGITSKKSQRKKRNKINSTNYSNLTSKLFKNTFYFEQMATDYLRLCKRYRALQMKCWQMEFEFGSRQSAPSGQANSIRLCCNVCGRSFGTIFQLLRHKQSTERHYVKRPRSRFSGFFSNLCIGCRKYFCTRLALRNHAQYICQLLPLRHLNRIPIKTFKCRYCCQITFTHWRLYRRHEVKCSALYMKRKRRKLADADGGGSLEVGKMGPALLSSPHIRQSDSCIDVLSSRNLDARYFRCDLCPRSFSQRKDLSVHKRGFHLQMKLYQCFECKQRFASKYEMMNCRHALSEALHQSPTICSSQNNAGT